MKKKILIAIFFTTIMLVIPFTAIADNPDCLTTIEPELESNCSDTKPINPDQSSLSAEEIDDVVIMAVEELAIFFPDDENIQQMQMLIEDQVMPQNWDQIAFCGLILGLIVLYVALFLGKAKDAIWDWIDEEGVLAFINAVLGGTYGTIALILATIFFELCLAAPALPQGQIYIQNNCGCAQIYQTDSLFQQVTNLE